MPTHPPPMKNPQTTATETAGFTLIELLVVVAIIAILAVIVTPVYQHFVGKAKVTVAQTTLVAIRDTLTAHVAETNTTYPTTIDFTTGQDDQGQTILQQPLREQISKDLFLPSIVYTGNAGGFTLTAQANDTDHTALVLTQNSLNIQGN